MCFSWFYSAADNCQFMKELSFLMDSKMKLPRTVQAARPLLNAFQTSFLIFTRVHDFLNQSIPNCGLIFRAKLKINFHFTFVADFMNVIGIIESRVEMSLTFKDFP